MSAKIVILKGSPRLNGNSSTLANQIAAGAKESGAELAIFDLHNMDIAPCDACETCQETDGVCIIKDDMQILYPKLRQADAIVLASPIYWFTISAQLKLCIDRWYAFESASGNALRGKKFAIVLAYGDTDLHSSGGINAIHTLESTCRYIGAEIVNIVHGSLLDVGDAANHPLLLNKAFKLGKMLALH